MFASSSRHTLLLTALVLLALTGCQTAGTSSGGAGSSTSAKSGKPELPQGYTCCNFHHEGDWISDSNYATLPMIPAGTPAKVTGYGRHRAYAELDGRKMRLGHDYGREQETLQQWTARMIVADDPKQKIAGYPAAVQAAIRQGKVAPGMTKEQVIISVGYPITQYAETAGILVVSPVLGVNTMQDLIALAKRRPGELSIGSWGNGTLSHLLSLQLNRSAGIDLLHVPYRSTTQGLTDVAGGQLSMIWDYPVSSIGFIQSGKLRALMVVGDSRVAPLPDVPSAAELGLAGMHHKAWGGFLAPAGTPRPIVDRLNAEIVRALRSPELERIFAEQGSRVVTSTPDEFAAFIRREQEELAALASAAGARLD